MRARVVRAFCTTPTPRKLWPAFNVPKIPESEVVMRELQADLVEKAVETGNFSVAIDSCKRLLEICEAINQPAPASGVRCMLARVYEYNGNHDKAATEWTHAITSKADLGPAAPEVKAARIISLLHSNQLSQAAAAAKSAAESYAHDERFTVLQALVAYRHGSLTDAVAILSRVFSSSDMYGQSLLLRGTCLGGMNEVEKARNALAKASEWFTERKKDWGVVAAGLQTRDIEETQKALKLSETYPNHPLIADALRVMASHLLEIHDPVSSEGLFRTAIIRSSNTAFFVPNFYTQSVYASVLSDFAYLLCHMEFNGQPRVKNALKLMQSPVQFGGQSYSLRGYMQDADIVKLADEEVNPPSHPNHQEEPRDGAMIIIKSKFHDTLQWRERQFRPGMFWWTEELTRPVL